MVVVVVVVVVAVAVAVDAFVVAGGATVGDEGGGRGDRDRLVLNDQPQTWRHVGHQEWLRRWGDLAGSREGEDSPLEADGLTIVPFGPVARSACHMHNFPADSQTRAILSSSHR